MAEEKEEVRIITGDGRFRLEQAQSTRRGKKSEGRPVVTVVQDFVPVGNFLDFLRQHAVVGLIIGFVIGGQVQSLVKQLVQSFLDPMTQLLFGTALSQRTFTLHFRGRAANFQWGALVYALIIFIFVLIVMYLTIRWLKLDKLEKEKEKEMEGKN
jgi:large conductance mechanosensitive channel protein